ncbi:MAG TPA: hypothetical protein PLY90_02070 [Candidatus Hydrogenedentes bacterium]|nr:hypothetical protein [Candidatus Hydrogenedentota bacterium]
MSRLLVLLLFGLSGVCAAQEASVQFRVEGKVLLCHAGNRELARADIPSVNDRVPVVRFDQWGKWVRVHLRWELEEAVEQNDLFMPFHLQFDPNFWWAPHLTPEEGLVIAQHVFRSPAVIAASEEGVLALVPDLDLCGKDTAAPWYMDFNAPEEYFGLGMSRTEVPEHVLFKKVPGMTLGTGSVDLSFYLAWLDGKEDIFNPWQSVAAFLWDRWGKALYDRGEPTTVSPERYVEHTYGWAFDRWAHAVWQEFDLHGTRVGSPVFIVTVTDSPNYPGHADQREFPSIWNQAWFSSLRAASGVFRYGRRTGNEDLMRRARLTEEFTLAAPLDKGVFPTVYRSDVERVTIDGVTVHRPKGWDVGYWVNSNRVPWEHGITDRWYNVLDMSWTALLLLRWHEEIEPDERILPYVSTYAERLLQLQDEDGFFPSWLDPETQKPSAVLAQSPQTSMSVTFLLKLAQMTGEKKYETAALRALDAVIREIIPAGQWEDYETYWSCCRLGQDHLGRRFERNAMFKQNTLSMFWTSEALLEAWCISGREEYLSWGRRTLDELSMVQQVWQPPFIYVPALGGWGVMNMDGEWNDSRQTLFAELFIEYGKVLGEQRYIERGIAAMKSGFVMMYCPENPAVKKLWEKVWTFFGPEDYGFMMENYAHGGVTTPDGEGMGNFTIYTWGNGAASEAWSRILDHHPELFPACQPEAE